MVFDVVWSVGSLLSSVGVLHPLMAGLDDLRSHISLTEEEEGGAEVPQQEADVIHRLAGRFFTKRVVNVDVVTQTFKPLWKPIGELKIRDVGENILLFEFEDILDLKRMLKYEHWYYDKNLMAFQRVEDVESVPYINYSHATFWIQLHNIPKKSLTCEKGELIGKSIGMVVKIADLEDDNTGDEKQGWLTRPERQMQVFREALDYCRLKDISFNGFPFTWCNRRLGDQNVWILLDRGVASVNWMLRFPAARIHHLDAFHSDHKPLLLCAGSEFK
nr:hypothetical protein CFP56_13843 [Quercus suber]